MLWRKLDKAWTFHFSENKHFLDILVLRREVLVLVAFVLVQPNSSHEREQCKDKLRLTLSQRTSIQNERFDSKQRFEKTMK